MRVWLIQIGEPLPIDGQHQRLLRIGIFANLLAAQGHEVLWWCSTFKPRDKSFRFNVAGTGASGNGETNLSGIAFETGYGVRSKKIQIDARGISKPVRASEQAAL